jgi:FMN reductase
MVCILGICGSTSPTSHTRVLVNRALDAARACGAQTDLFDVASTPLPLFEAARDYSDEPNVRLLMEKVKWAEGYVIGSPEYHGCMSGAMKNVFDFLYHEISGKLFGLVAATGGSQGVSCFDTMRAAILYCHGWTLPYQVAGSGNDFDADDQLKNPKVEDRLRRLGRDLAVYSPLLWGRFRDDLAQPAAAACGFAHWTQ